MTVPQRRSGPDYWRSLDELADTPEFRRWMGAEFPAAADEWLDGFSRRRFLQLMAASFALAGLGGTSGCWNSFPPQQIVPYVRPQPTMTQGQPLVFATAILRQGYAEGVLVTSHMGRPIKIEGNPDHPASLGASSIFAQAEVLNLYDPDRSQAVYHAGQISTWDLFASAWRAELARLQQRRGAGLHLLTATLTSPTVLDQLAGLLQSLPEARWHVHEPIGDDHEQAALAQAFGEPVELVYRFDRANVVVSLDCDFLAEGPASVRYARDFASRRNTRVAAGAAAHLNRLYVIEPTPSVTGINADHRLPLRAADLERFAIALATELGVPEPRGASFSDAGDRRSGSRPATAGAALQNWVRAVARDLQKNAGTAVVLAGRSQPPRMHVLVAALNERLGNFGQTIFAQVPVRNVNNIAGRELPAPGDVVTLARAIEAGTVETLIVLDANPAYTAPADLPLATLLGRIPRTVHAAQYRDETGQRCHWHLPVAHVLESWSDARAYDGTATLIQPLIAPLFAGRALHEILGLLAGEPVLDARDLLRRHWQKRRPQPDFERWWRAALQQGVVPDTAAAGRAVRLRTEALAAAFTQATTHASAPVTDAARADETKQLELVLRPDPTIWDGRYSNNAWLQELPKPVTKLTWDNAIFLSPATAGALGLKSEAVVTLKTRDLVVQGPVLVVPGQAEGCATLTFGYGREHCGRVATGRGLNAYTLRRVDALWFATAAVLTKGQFERHALAITQGHFALEGRPLLRTGTLAEFNRDHATVRETPGAHLPQLSIYPARQYPGQQWGMQIDLTRCIGCSACTIACQAENNIPVVGYDGVLRGREMHWIRVDQYFEGAPDNPHVHSMPVPCMHCQNAPCELVCPVGATQHSDDGLNDMVYNRCIGTRYCSNNCPYKVRRFNFFNYTYKDPETVQLQRNPQVTVRARGVMEKCTYCVQRIRAAEVQARIEHRPIRDGEVVTACQQVCPTGAIVFGNINDPAARVTALKELPHDYALLEDLQTQPRTTYLAGVRNPNPELAEVPDNAEPAAPGSLGV